MQTSGEVLLDISGGSADVAAKPLQPLHPTRGILCELDCTAGTLIDLTVSLVAMLPDATEVVLATGTAVVTATKRSFSFAPELIAAVDDAFAGRLPTQLRLKVANGSTTADFKLRAMWLQ